MTGKSILFVLLPMTLFTANIFTMDNASMIYALKAQHAWCVQDDAKRIIRHALDETEVPNIGKVTYFDEAKFSTFMMKNRSCIHPQALHVAHRPIVETIWLQPNISEQHKMATTFQLYRAITKEFEQYNKQDVDVVSPATIKEYARTALEFYKNTCPNAMFMRQPKMYSMHLIKSTTLYKQPYPGNQLGLID